MEPTNIEKEFKKKLEERTIQPAEMSWDRLDAMLTVTEERRPRRNFGWLYVAANILGFVLIATVFLSQTEELVDAPKNGVVIEEQIQIDKAPSIPTQTNQIEQTKKELPHSNQNQVVFDNKKVNNQNKIQLKSNQLGTKTINQESQNHVAENSISNQKTNNPNQALQVVIPKTQNPIPDTQNAQPSYVNVDELLASVEKTSKNEVNKKTGIKVNANGLLAQVDGELELSFREKVIKTVNKNYKTVKVALANRNMQE